MGIGTEIQRNKSHTDRERVNEFLAQFDAAGLNALKEMAMAEPDLPASSREFWKAHDPARSHPLRVLMFNVAKKHGIGTADPFA